MTTEMILPSGKFATLRAITWQDWLVVKQVMLKNQTIDPVVLLAARCVQIDSAPITVTEALALDVRDGVALSKAISLLINGPVLQDS